MALRSLTFLLVFIVTSWLTVSAESKQVSWGKIGDDLELGISTLNSTALISSKLYLIRTTLRRYQIGVAQAKEIGLKRADIDHLCKRAKALVCINANFFDDKSNPLGLVIVDGLKHNFLHRGGNTLTGVFYTKRNMIGISRREKTPTNGILYAVQAGPRLLMNGQKVSGFETKNSSSRRSGVCIDNKKRLIIFASATGFSGVRLHSLQELLVSKELGCTDALNFDGGGSTQLFISPKIPGASSSFKGLTIAGRDKIPVALTLATTRKS